MSTASSRETSSPDATRAGESTVQSTNGPTDPTTTTDLFGPGDPGERTHLSASSCDACGRAEFPPRPQCPACGEVMSPLRLEGPARLRVSTAVLAQPPGSRVETPYGVGVAEFDNGLCVIGLLAGAAPLGARVEIVVHEPYEDGRIFAFRQVSG